MFAPGFPSKGHTFEKSHAFITFSGVKDHLITTQELSKFDKELYTSRGYVCSVNKQKSDEQEEITE